VCVFVQQPDARGAEKVAEEKVRVLTYLTLCHGYPPGVLGTFVQSELHFLFVQVSNLFYSLIFYSCSNLMRKS
jgi:hypothetical protein